MKLNILSESRIDPLKWPWRVCRLDENGSILGFGALHKDDRLVTPWAFVQSLNRVQNHDDYSRLPYLLRAYRDNTHYKIMKYPQETDNIIKEATDKLILMGIVSLDLYNEYMGHRMGQESVGFHDDDEFSELAHDLILLVTPQGVIRRDTDVDVSQMFPTEQLQTELAKVRSAADGYLRRKFR